MVVLLVVLLDAHLDVTMVLQKAVRMVGMMVASKVLLRVEWTDALKV